MSHPTKCECGWPLPARVQIGTDDAAAAAAISPHRDALLASVRCPVCGKDWEAHDEGDDGPGADA